MFGTGRLIKCCRKVILWARPGLIGGPTGNMTGAWRIRITAWVHFTKRIDTIFTDGRARDDGVACINKGATSIHWPRNKKSYVFQIHSRNPWRVQELVSGRLVLRRFNALKINRERCLAVGRCIAYRWTAIPATEMIWRFTWLCWALANLFSATLMDENIFARVKLSLFFRIGDTDLTRAKNVLLLLPRGFTRTKSEPNGSSVWKAGCPK